MNFLRSPCSGTGGGALPTARSKDTWMERNYNMTSDQAVCLGWVRLINLRQKSKRYKDAEGTLYAECHKPKITSDQIRVIKDFAEELDLEVKWCPSDRKA